MESGSDQLPDKRDEIPSLASQASDVLRRRIVECPACNNATLEEDIWGERDPVTGLLYPEPRLFCTTCQWVQSRSR